jgi:hypothetical protein
MRIFRRQRRALGPVYYRRAPGYVDADVVRTLGKRSVMLLWQDEAISSGSYVPWGWLSISVPNLIVIIVMIVLFVLAITLPFPKERRNPRKHS